jgi:repressor LexA
MTAMRVQMDQLTDRQQQIFDYITDYLDDNGYPPTVREISGKIGVNGTATAIKHLVALERKGYIQRRMGHSRSINLCNRGPGAVSVPVVGRVKAGQPMPAVEDIEGYYSLDLSWIHGDNCFFLRVEGDSMIGAHILDGDLALIRPQRTAENGQIVVALIDGEATLKRFYLEKDLIRLQPENPAMEPIIIRPGEAEMVVVGRLLKIVRNYK